jgi:MFS family permease
VTTEAEPGRRAGLPAYRDVVRAPRWGWWALCTFGARLPVAMAPLALVLLGREISGGYALGGLLVAAHTLGEAVAAPFVGAGMDRWSPRRALAWCLGAEAVLFVAVAAAAAARAPVPALLLLTALAGAIPAGAPGGLRALLTGLVGRSRLAPALSVDTVLNQACWTLGPILVAGAVAVWSATATVAVIAVAATVGALASWGLPRSAAVHLARPESGDVLPLLRVVGRTLLLTAALRLLLGTLTAVAAPLFAESGSLAHVGAALAAYALGTAVGGLLYSARATWPGSYERQADVVLMGLGAVVAAAFLVHEPAALVLLYGVAGLLEGPVVVARSLHLEALLPEHRRATGFSMQYAAIGWGFAAGGLLLAKLIDPVGPHGLLLLAGTIVALCATVAATVPARRPQA